VPKPDSSPDSGYRVTALVTDSNGRSFVFVGNTTVDREREKTTAKKKKKKKKKKRKKRQRNEKKKSEPG
jgi:hypothetical protein